MLAEGTKGPLVAKVILLGVLVLDETLILLVDRVVRQVHVLILLVDFLGVGLGGKTCESLLEDVNFKRLVPRDDYVDPQVKLVAIDQQWVRDVLGDHTRLVNVHIVDVVHDVDASALARVSRLNDPNVFLALVLLELLVVIVKVAKFIGKDVGVGCEIEGSLSKSFLESDNVEAEAVLPCDLVTLREVVDLLVLVETLVLVALAGAGGPENIPFVRVG